MAASLPPVVQKFLADFDKQLHQPGRISDVLTTVEQKTGLKRLHLAGGLLVLHALYLIFGKGAELLCNVTGFLYPAYVSIKAIETSTKSDDTQWLTYWVIFALFNVAEFFSDFLVSYFPLYWLAKFLFVVWLQLPNTRGAEVIYGRVVRPFVEKHGNVIDAAIGKANEARETARQAFEDHVKPN